jgi:hypothetical protein
MQTAPPNDIAMTTPTQAMLRISRPSEICPQCMAQVSGLSGPVFVDFL